MNNLINQLGEEFLKTVPDCNRLGYYPARFLQMLEKQGPVDTAISLVMQPKYHEGFTKLWKLERLDLTVEAIILRYPYNQLFAKEVLGKAKSKLKELHYNPENEETT